MEEPEKIFKLFLRVGATLSLFAIFAVFMPYSWMNSVHKWLSLGELPAEPIVGYLARSTSAFYAFFGGLIWIVSFDLQKYRSVLIYIGAIHIIFGLMFLLVDLSEGLPFFWTVSEVSITIIFGVIILIFSCSKSIRRKKEKDL